MNRAAIKMAVFTAIAAGLVAAAFLTLLRIIAGLTELSTC